MSNEILKIGASREQLKAYFEAVCNIIDQNNEEYPINLDEVWPLVYGRKEEAVRFLTSDFIQDVDYKVLRRNAENPLGGRPTNDYYLTTSCFEYFIARKVREVFEVYRQVFHKARKGEIHQTKAERTLATIRQLCELAEKDVELERKQLQLEREQQIIASKVSQIETQIRPNGYMSVMGYANIHHLNIGAKAAAAIGRLASKWCKRNGARPEKTRHERWGEVNTYPLEALKLCFSEFYPHIA